MWVPRLNRLGSERNVQVKRWVSLDAHSGQSFDTGFLTVTLALRTMSKDWSLTSGSVTVRRSWPESNAPEDWDGVP